MIKNTWYWSSYPFVYHIQNRYLLGFHSICMSATRKNSALFLKFGTKLVWASFGELAVLRFHFPLVTPVVFRRATRVWSNKTKMKRLQQAQINIKSTIFPLETESRKCSPSSTFPLRNIQKQWDSDLTSFVIKRKRQARQITIYFRIILTGTQWNWSLNSSDQFD